MSELDSKLEPEEEDEEFAELLREVAKTPSVVTPLSPGDVVDETFEVQRRLGAGGMGVVYLAQDLRLNRSVALKVHKPGAAHEGMARMLREAKAMARLSHPNVVTIYEVGTFREDLVYIAMEYIDGQTLRAWLETPRSGVEIIELLLQAGRGLAAAHNAGLVHRDFKPENVLIGQDSRARVVDFGVARAQKTKSPTPRSAPQVEGALTATGALMGTPVYMAPEQHQGEQADARADQFSFCVVLYEALYNVRPFETTKTCESSELRPGTLVPRTPGGVKKLLIKGLSAAPKERFESMDALLAALRGLLDARRRRAIAGVSGALLLGVAGLVVAGRAPAPCATIENTIYQAWEPLDRSAVIAGLKKTGQAPEGTVERTTAILDSYVDDLATGRKEACVATWVQRAQSGALHDQRVHCLEQRLLRFVELTRLFKKADVEVARKAVRTALKLPDAKICADTNYLTALVKPPEQPEVKKRVASERRMLARAKTLYEAGRYGDALTLTQEIEQRTTNLDYLPLRAQVLHQLGLGEIKAKDHATAKETLERAFFMARESGDGPQVAEIASDLTELLAYHMSKHELGLLWARHAMVDVRRLGGGPLEGTVLISAGTALESAGRFNEAIEKTERALEIFKRTRGEEHTDVAESMLRLGSIYEAKGEALKALPYLQAALELREKIYGDVHPEVRSSLSTYGLALAALGKTDEAIKAEQRALEISTKVFGSKHVTTGFSYLNLGVAYYYARALEKAEAAFSRALQIVEPALGSDHPDTALCLSNLALPLSALGKREEAIDAQLRALKINRKALGADHPSVGTSHANVASALINADRFKEALEHTLAAVRIHERVAPNSTTVAFGLDLLGRAYIGIGQDKKAIAPLTRALAIRKEKKFASRYIAATHLFLAKALQKTSLKRARENAKEALRLYKLEGEAAKDPLRDTRDLLRSLGVSAD